MSGHIVITGCAGGIGKALARHFLDQAWQVSGIDVLPGSIENPAYRHFQVDILNENALSAAFLHAAGHAPITTVIANAAITDREHRPVADLDYATWQRIMRVNVDGAFLTARVAAAQMPNGGNLIFVTSSLAFFDHALANDAPYCTSKSAVEMLMRVLAKELAPRGLNVNSLFPSVKIDTSFFDHLPAAERRDLASADILNDSALFLATQPPGGLTGVSLDQQRWSHDFVYRQTLTNGEAA